MAGVGLVEQVYYVVHFDTCTHCQTFFSDGPCAFHSHSQGSLVRDFVWFIAVSTAASTGLEQLLNKYGNLELLSLVGVWGPEEGLYSSFVFAVGIRTASLMVLPK